MVPSIVDLEMEVDEELFPLRGTTAASQKMNLKTRYTENAHEADELVSGQQR
jgi:hypothetical protein